MLPTRVGENLQFGVARESLEFGPIASTTVAPKFLTLLCLPRFLEAANLRKKR
jgi:hypothetical protein